MKSVDFILILIFLLCGLSGHVIAQFWISPETELLAINYGVKLATQGLAGIVEGWQSLDGWLAPDTCPARKLFHPEMINYAEGCLSGSTRKMFLADDAWKTCKAHAYGSQPPETGSEWLDRICEPASHSKHINFVVCLVMKTRQPYQENKQAIQESLIKLVKCFNDVATMWVRELIAFYKETTPEHRMLSTVSRVTTSKAIAEAVTWFVDFFTLEDKQAGDERDWEEQGGVEPVYQHISRPMYGSKSSADKDQEQLDSEEQKDEL